MDFQKLKECLPSIQGCISGKILKTKDEWSAPCPWCGGDDRFIFWTEADSGFGRFLCRKCDAKGDIVDFHCRLEEISKKELIKKYMPPGNCETPTEKPIENLKQEKQSKKTGREYLSVNQIENAWKQIQAEYAERPKNPKNNFNTLKYLLRTKRKIDPAVIKSSIKAGLLSLKWHDLTYNHLYTKYQSEIAPVVCYLYRDADYKPCAIQYTDETNQGLIFSHKRKKFLPGSNASDAFFIIGKPLNKADTIVLVESPLDALSIINVMPDVCCVSLSNTNGGKVEKIRDKLKGKTVICFFDNDEGGQGATQDAVNALKRKDILSVEWNPADPRGFDVNDLLKADRVKEIIKMVKNAKVVELKPGNKKSVKDQDSLIQKKIAELNKKYAAVMNGGQFSILKEVIDPVFNRPDIHFLKKDSFGNWFANDKMEITKGEKTEMVSIANLWMTSPDRRQYKGVVFSPEHDVPGYYNLYRSFDIEPKEGEWNLIQNHIYNILCGGDNDLYQWVFAWLARIVQDPGGERPGTSIVLRGKQGCGKGIIVSAFGSIFGSHYRHIQSSDHIFGKHNGMIKDAIVLFLDEVVWGGNKKEEGILKTLVTEPTYNIEPKYIDAFTVKSHVNLILASNNRWCVPAGLEERRFCILDVSSQYCGNREYFNKLSHQINNGGREAMLHELLNTDISMIDLRTIPRTEALLDQIVYSMDDITKFWFDSLCNGSFYRNDFDGWPPEDKEFNRSLLYNEYMKYCEANRKKYRKAEREFFKELKKLCPGSGTDRRSIDGKKTHVAWLPNLDKCRSAFNRVIGMKVKW